MKIAALQTYPKHKDIEHNLDEMLRLIETTDAELLIFPELALTGYLFTSPDEARPYALPVDSEPIQRLRKACEHARKSIVFGHLELADTKLFNSAVLIDRRGELVGAYRKTHLFHFERQVFAEGDTGFKVFEIETEAGTFKLGIMICYDWRFPESARSLALQGAEIIAIPSNIVTRTGMLHTVLQTRAFENKVIVAFADRVGSEEELTYRGESSIINYNGEFLDRLDDTSTGIATAEVDPKATLNKSFSDLNDIFKDRRPAIYTR